jgi:hypothetical protein
MGRGGEWGWGGAGGGGEEGGGVKETLGSLGKKGAESGGRGRRVRGKKKEEGGWHMTRGGSSKVARGGKMAAKLVVGLTLAYTYH